jgi:TP901 family phage tail tape measure protein/lambda family phage tail tape measure protein
MTTANLSVGLKTADARKEFLAFKEWMKTNGKGISVELDAGRFVNDIQSTLRNRKLRPQIDENDLSQQIRRAISKGFSDQNYSGWKLRINSQDLTEQVKSAIRAGMRLAGGNIETGLPSAPAHGAAPANILQTIKESLVPAVDELVKAATVLSGNARGAGAPRSGGSIAAATRYSQVNPDGSRTSATQRLENPEAILAQVRATNAVLQAQQQFQRNLKEGMAFGPNREQLERMKQDWDRTVDSMKAKSAGLADPRALLGLPSRDEMSAFAKQLSAQMRGSLADEALRAKSAGRVDPRTLLGLPSRDETASIGRQIAAQMRGDLADEALRAKSAGRVDARTLLGLPSREEMSSFSRQLAAQMNGALTDEALRAKSAGRVDARTLLGLPASSEMASFTAKLKADMTRAVQETQSAIAAAYEKAKFGAQGSFNPTGQKIAGAAAIQQQFGASAASAFLGKSSFLLDEVGNLESYRKAVKAAADEHEKLAPKVRASNVEHQAAVTAMNDAHSAARGLAGSLGGLWLTWGNTAAIAGAAAIGASMRSVFEVGTQLEYQLTFVKQLSEGTTVSLDKFGNAVRLGMLVAPTEAAQAMRGLAQNGLTVQQSLSALPTILQLATAGELSLSDAALGATGVMAAFNLSVDDLGRVSDVFAKAAAMSNTSVQGMIESMKQASTVGDQYGVTLEETAASLATMAKRNITGTAAGTAFRNMMVELATPSKKAKEALAQLHVELYNGNGSLKTYSEVLDTLRNKTILLNDQGRLTFLNEIFGERGAKAVNAILADYDQYRQTLQTLQQDARGFGESINTALGETTKGKIQALFTEFQLSAASAFETGNDAAKHFIDTLRIWVGSDDFKKMLSELTQGVAALTNFLVEHGKVVGATVAIWAGMRMLSGLVGVFNTLRTAMLGAEAAAVGLGVAGRAALGALTGGVGLLVALAAEFLLTRENANGATDAQKAFADSLVLQEQNLRRSISALDEEIGFLQRRNALIQEGKTAEEAERIARLNKDQKDAATSMAAATRAAFELAGARRTLAEAEARRKTVAQAGGNIATEDAAVQNAQREVKRLQDVYDRADAVALAARTETDRKMQAEQLRSAGSREAQAQAFNKRIEEVMAKNPAINASFLKINLQEAGASGADSFSGMLRARTDQLNSMLSKFTPPDKHAQAAAHRDALAESNALMRRLRDEDAQFAQSSEIRRKLLEATFDPKLFGNEVAARANEKRAEQDLLAVKQRHVKVIAELNTQLNGNKNLTDADRTNLRSRLESEQSALTLLERRIDSERELSVIKARNKDIVEANDFQKEKDKLAQADQKRLQDLAKAYDKKVMDPATAAAYNEQLKVSQDYASAIAEHTRKVEISENAIAAIKAMQVDYAGEFSAELKAALTAEEQNLATETMRLGVLKAQASSAAEVAGRTARQHYEAAQTASYGWSKFWEEYRSQGESNAVAVYDIMKKSTGQMSDAIANFVTTGKLHFKQLVASILSDVARMLATRAMTQFLGYIVGAATGGFGGGGTAVNGSAGTASIPSTMAAWGHVMTGAGPMRLRKYANGGIARTPQMAIYGEGSRSEAYVPLPDGRRIPVDLQGAGGGGTTIMANVTVHVDGNGKSTVESDASGEQARALGGMIKDRVIEVIVEQQRPGGVLAR